MKKNSLFLTVFLAFSLQGFSQILDSEVEYVVDLLGIQKKETVSQLVNVPANDSLSFWKIYDEYQEKNRAVTVNRLNLYEAIAKSYSNMTPKLADSLTTVYSKNREEQEKNLKRYSAKIKQATNSIVAFQFYQTEVYLLTLFRAQIMKQIPTYGELLLRPKKK